MRTHSRYEPCCSTPPTRGVHAEAGSALLIVLGFLTFMMISAVSFAVYMRIERQASSNYRHSVTARHLLNAGLYRAIDEIDSELRIPEVNSTKRPIKFPDWPGRVRDSAVNNGQDNGQNARVLSLESLSFIPGILVNDVRRYAVPNKSDPSQATWMGAKWRKISMPVRSLGGGENAYEESVLGRYAYVCVNVSDMLDVNVCKAAVRDAVTNRVGIGHLFGPNTDALRKTFDEGYKTKDRHYETLQDFYACMYARSDATFGSPYHEFVKDGEDTGFDDAINHVLIADSIVKAQPARSDAVNILQYAKTGAPLTAAKAFAAQLLKTMTSPPSGAEEHFTYCLRDYLDDDDTPFYAGKVSTIYRPSLEMVPMVSQIVLAKTPALSPVVGSGPEEADPADPSNPIKSIQLKWSQSGIPPPISVEFVFPFKYGDQKDLDSFTCETEAYLVAIKSSADLKSGDTGLQNLGNIQPGRIFKKLTKINATVPIPPFNNTEDSVNNCYKKIIVTFQQPAPAAEILAYYKNGVLFNDATHTSRFAENDEIRVAMVVFVGVKHGNDFVDMAPASPLMTATPTWGNISLIKNNLIFQTDTFKIAATVTKQLAYDYNSLEVPDPRFNHKASNWLGGDEPSNTADARMNASTKALLNDGSGRDGGEEDPYMFVANSEYLRSPGEFGFIIRPFPFTTSIGKSVSFKAQTAGADAEEAEYMFRTMRVYDHGTQPTLARDKIYEYFTIGDPKGGAVPGARVNPFSDIKEVLYAAVENMPVDYWFAAQKDPDVLKDYTFNSTKRRTDAEWKKIKDGWYKSMILATPEINVTWRKNLSDVYGRYDTFGWYSKGDPTAIFDGSLGGTVSGLSKPLHEIDRKMMMTYSLNSFSDRQQLFLYILRAEATSPAFVGSSESGMRSLAGGRAVALVWRDPYPQGYEKPINPNGATEGNYLGKGQRTWYQQDGNNTLNRVSPWYQYNVNKYDDKLEAFDADPSITGNRLDGYHEHRILYFKQLDN